MKEGSLKGCPQDELLQELAAGGCSPEIEQQTISHVAQCSRCAPLLQKYLHIFADEITPEEAEFISGLKTSDPQYQREWLREHLPVVNAALIEPIPPAPVPPPVPWWLVAMQSWRGAVIAAVALVAVVLGAVEAPVLMANRELSHAKKQVAAAFSARRTIELRPPDAEFAPYKPFPLKLDGESGHDLDEITPPLLEARSTVARKLQAGKEDPRWLQIEGRIFLWEATPSSLEKAEKNFEKARADGLNSPDLEIDLAATYFEIDNRSETPNLQRTLNLLSKVLTENNLSRDTKATALFNLSIAYEKTQAWDLAVNTWKEYLSVDGSSAWAEEARKHLKEAESKTRAAVIYKDPSAFLQHASDWDMRDHEEEYQDIALTEWVPDAITHADAHEASLRLARSILEQHHDTWLRDFIGQVSGASLYGVQQLNAAIRSNAGGKYKDAGSQAANATAIFSTEHNLAGVLRATFEEVYAQRRALDGPGCSSRADALWNTISSTSYRWLQARVLLEKAECSNLKGNFAGSDGSFNAARLVAEREGFPQLMLRNLQISSGFKHLRGDCDESWKESVDGLRIFARTANASTERLYQFYALMLQCSLETGSLYSAERLIRHSLELREDTSGNIDNDPLIDGLLHLHLANVLLARRQMAEANVERARALRLFKKVPDTTVVERYCLFAEIELADLQLQHGDPLLALKTLDSMNNSSSRASDGFFSLRYHEVLGNVHFRLHNLEAAASAYRSAIRTAESVKTGPGPERLRWFHIADESYRGMVRVLLEENKQDEALEEWERYKSEPMAQRWIFAGGLSPSQMPARNKKVAGRNTPSLNQTRLVYATFRDGVQIWSTRNRSTSGAWVQVRQQELINQVREFIAKCATENSNLNDLQQQGADLYKLLVQPVAAELRPSDTLVIELDRRSYNLPMEALRTPDGRYLGEDHPIIYSPGTLIEQALRVPVSITPLAKLVFLDATSEYLPGVDEERREVSATFHHSTVIHGSQARWEQVQSAAKGSEIIHYTGHGRRDGNGTSLDFNNTRSIRAQDFTPAMFHRALLAVLAACSSGRGSDYGLLDTNSLINALLRAKVPAIIASRWNVDSAATSQLMIRFYAHLGSSGNVSDALSAARKDVLMSRAHPYYWAGFGLTGRAA